MSCNTFKLVIFLLGLIFQYVKNYYLFRLLFKPIVSVKKFCKEFLHSFGIFNMFFAALVSEETVR